MKVTFSVVEEFLDELRHEAAQQQVADSIVRATYRYQQAKDVSFLYYMSVVAGFVVRSKLIELNQLCGDVVKGPPEPESNTRTKAVAERIMGQITQATERLGLALRRGVFEE